MLFDITRRTRTVRHGLLVAILVLGVALAAPGTLSATEIEHKDSGLTLVLPDGWTGRGGEIVAVTDSEESGWIYFWSVDYGTVDAAATSLTAELASILQDVKQKGKAEPGKQGELETRRAQGTGAIGDFKVNWTAVVVEGSGDRVGILLGFSDAKTWKKHEADFEALLDSIRKTSP